MTPITVEVVISGVVELIAVFHAIELAEFVVASGVSLGCRHQAAFAQRASQAATDETGVPVARLMEGEVQKLIRLEDVLHQRVIGQHAAVRVVANAIRIMSIQSPLGTPYRSLYSHDDVRIRPV